MFLHIGDFFGGSPLTWIHVVTCRLLFVLSDVDTGSGEGETGADTSSKESSVDREVTTNKHTLDTHVTWPLAL